MKMMKISSMAFLLALTCALVLTGGCKSKNVAPYTPTGKGGAGSMADGSFREGNITEEMRPGMGSDPWGAGAGSGRDGFGGNSGFGPANEGLDSTGGRGSGSLYSNADSRSDAWKRAHGRSSEGMTPVYFDFDSAVIRADQIPAIEANGAFLNNNASRMVVVEGNTDYRGTKEYNLALGERRAASAKNYLIELGVAEHRIRTISYGEERPLFQDDEAGNRRADFVLE